MRVTELSRRPGNVHQVQHVIEVRREPAAIAKRNQADLGMAHPLAAVERQVAIRHARQTLDARAPGQDGDEQFTRPILLLVRQ